MGRRINVGDLFEIETPKGLGYFQYCHREGGGPLSMGVLIRALRGLNWQRPVDLDEVARRRTLFWAYFPLGSALNQKLVRFLDNVEVPSDAKEYPLLRAKGGIDRTGLVHDWMILTRDEELRSKALRVVQILNDEEQCLSDLALYPYALLVERIEEQYTPKNDPVMLWSVRHWTKVRGTKSANHPER